MPEDILQLDKDCVLRLTPQNDGFGLAIECEAAVAALSAMPLAVQIFAEGVFTWKRGTYATVSQSSGTITATGQVQVDSAFIHFTDTLSSQSGHLYISREVRVEGTEGNLGFLTALEWQIPGASIRDEWFVPGLWYGCNEHVPSYAVGSARQRALAEYVAFREDRLPLPFTMHYNEQSKLAFVLTHLDGVPQTVAADDNDAPLIDERLSFGSFGMYDKGETLAFWFPGTEGDVRYPPMWTLDVGNQQKDSPRNPFSSKSAVRDYDGWNYRYHPLRNDVRQQYELEISLFSGETYLDAQKRAWRHVYAEYAPQVQEAPLAEVEVAQLELLVRMVATDKKALGIPTWIDCFTGKPGRLQNSFGVGFVARNLEVAQFFIAAGHKQARPELLQLGRSITDYWTAKAGLGLSHTEWDRAGKWVDGGKAREDTQVFLRDESEAHSNCLNSWLIERDAGVEYPKWLAWCVSYGDWLLENCNGTNAFYRAYTLDAFPVHLGRADCIHVVPFLLKLTKATGNGAYAELAYKTASFIWETYHRNGEFLGGTLDNPYCCDKEASAIALEAYLALFESTGEQKWLEAAQIAAQVCETWIFAWNIPMPVDDKDGRFFCGETTVGYQLITSGFSAFDIYLTRQVGDFARLAELTADEHYLDVARIVLHNTKNTIQKDAEYGYALPGMQIEHWSLGRGRGFGLNSGWLPWGATSHLIGIEAARRFPQLWPGDGG